MPHPRRQLAFCHGALMSSAFGKPSKVKGVVPATASLIVPGVGQLMNGQGTKAVGVFGIALATGAAFMTGLPLIGAVIGVAHVATHVYAVGDAYVQARKKRR